MTEHHNGSVPEAVVFKNPSNSRIRIGAFLPAATNREVGELWVLSGVDEAENTSQVVDAFLPSIAGMFALHALNCGPISPERADSAAMIQALSLAALDMLLQESGKQNKEQSRYDAQFSAHAGTRPVPEVIHQIHHTSSEEWNGVLRPQVKQLGGIAEQWAKQPSISRAAIARAGGSFLALPPGEESHQNIFVATAFAQHVRPRLAALPGITPLQLEKKILDLTKPEAGQVRDWSEALRSVAGIGRRLWPRR